MNGNISKEGIQSDLEWMSRIGLGGVQVFDAALATPQVVDHRVEYMTPEWKEDFRYAMDLARQLGLDVAIAGSPGWSETGGPWVKPAEAMKKYVWSETRIEGGRHFTGMLAHPPTVTGRFQNTPVVDPRIEEPSFYADAAVVAFRTPEGETRNERPKWTSSAGPVDGEVLSDGDASTHVELAASAEKGGGSIAWLAAEYARPATMRSVTLSLGRDGRGVAVPAVLEASDDGLQFRPVLTIPAGIAMVETFAFSPTKARFFRSAFHAGASLGQSVWVNEFTLHAEERVHHFEEKAAFQQALDLYGFATPAADAGSVVARQDVVDLRDKMRADGTLDWMPPAGHWTVLRLGYSLTGTTNHPATKEATGLEVDKLNREHVKAYMDSYLRSYEETVGADMMGKRGISDVVTDSWEAGTQNWTDAMLAEFRRRRGYDPTPWLPVLAGHIVASAQASDQFLWDFRKTIADLTADEHYGQIHDSLKQRGMGQYGESHEGDRAFIADGMEVKKRTSVPMGAMWTQPIGVHTESFRYNADDRESSSVAHIYGQNIAAAESMTAKVEPWAYSPATLKPTVDQEFLNGINRIAIHESTHQPLMDKAPGLTLGIYGQWFNRNETWAEQAGPWIDYLARSSYMLQQGRYVADVLYFYGEDSNITAIFRDRAPDVPEGYNFDYLNADGLMHALQLKDGRITTASGMQYRVLVLDRYASHMSLPVLRALYRLVEAGAVVAGAKPTDTPSLADNQAEFDRLNTSLFGDGTGVRAVGKGKVYAGAEVRAVLASLNVAPDFAYTRPEADAQVRFLHRTANGTEIYFVDNRSEHENSFDATFRVAEREPEVWHAESGEGEAVSYRMHDGVTTVPLRLKPWESVFVVFGRQTETRALRVPAIKEALLTEVQGPWEVSFQPGRGAPASVVLERLASWSSSSDSGVRYFSGAGTYTKSIEAPASWFAGKGRLWLDLGDVKNLATVAVNGRDLGVLWHAPYRVDVTPVLRPGSNDVSITVYDSWVNRLIGDQQPGAKKYTFTDFVPYHADSPLQPAGLIGPVRMLRTSTQ